MKRAARKDFLGQTGHIIEGECCSVNFLNYASIGGGRVIPLDHRFFKVLECENSHVKTF
jgi:hypothetical protein